MNNRDDTKDTPLDAIIHLVNHRVPYDDWPDELKIAGVSEDFLGIGPRKWITKDEAKQMWPDPNFSQSWIKCSDSYPIGFPEDFVFVLAWSDETGRKIAFYDVEEKEWTQQDTFKTINVTHWMPLPEPPNDA